MHFLEPHKIPPHSDRFYPTDIPMYYGQNYGKSQLDILKEHPSYPAFDPSKVTFADLDESIAGMYSGDKDLTTLNLKYTDPTNINPEDLRIMGHETVHRTLDERLPVNKARHGIPAAVNLMYGNLETTLHPDIRKLLESQGFDASQKGPKRAYPGEIKNPLDKRDLSVEGRTEHLLTYMLDNMAYGPEAWDEGNLYDVYPSRYTRAFAQEIADDEENYSLPSLRHGARKYWKPRNAHLGNAPGEVRRGILGLQDTFRNAALKYTDIMKNYKEKQAQEQDRQGGQNPSAQSFRSAPGGLSQAQSRAARGDPEGTGGGWKWAQGGLIDIALPGRSRYI